MPIRYRVNGYKMDPVYDMLQKFLVVEFSPFEEERTTEKFTVLSKSALKLLKSDDTLCNLSHNKFILKTVFS